MTLTDEQILEGNKAIIKFLGYKLSEGEDPIWMHQHSPEYYYTDTLSFHRFFDELIPVCKKCKAIVDINAKEKQSELVSKWNDIYLTFGSMDIELIFTRVVEFINLYNKNKS